MDRRGIDLSLYAGSAAIPQSTDGPSRMGSSRRQWLPQTLRRSSRKTVHVSTSGFHFAPE